MRPLLRQCTETVGFQSLSVVGGAGKRTGGEHSLGLGLQTPNAPRRSPVRCGLMALASARACAPHSSHADIRPSTRGSPRGPRVHDGTITTERVDQMWGTDMTTVATGEGPAAVFIAVDHCSAECMGVHASARATRHDALEPIRQAVLSSFGVVGKGVARDLKIRHDHGSQYMSADFQNEIRFLGTQSSPAFVRVPEGNGCTERYIGTLKENLLRVRWFDTIEALRCALLEFQQIYNEHWLIQRHGHHPPAAIRREQTMNTQQAS